MIDNRKLYEAIDSIDEDIVSEAAEYRFADRSFIPRLLAAAAAVLLAAGCTFAVTKLINKTPRQEAALPTETASNEPTEMLSVPGGKATPVPTPDISSMRIVYGNSEFWTNDEETPRGSVRIVGELYQALEEPETSPCLYAVDVIFIYSASDKVKELSNDYWDRLEEAENDPVYREFYLALFDWYNENGADFTLEDAKIWDEQGLEGFAYRFLEEQHGIFSEERIAEYKEAFERVQNARKNVQQLPDIIACSDEIRELIMDKINEMSMNGLYFDVSSIGYGSRGWHCSALLSKEQLLTFPTDPEEAYLICFSNQDTLWIDE